MTEATVYDELLNEMIAGLRRRLDRLERNDELSPDEEIELSALDALLDGLDELRGGYYGPGA